ncbi:MAG TPA: ATP-binding protein [candidate division Zixibacteria bacterium]|nr:ATP-binding protein [candidate division Zixibacteria bacterium]
MSKTKDSNATGRIVTEQLGATPDPDANQAADIFADLEATLEEVAEANPRIELSDGESSKAVEDLRALLEASLAVNSSLVADDVLRIVMQKAIELMQAERGLIMLLDEEGELKVRMRHNLAKEDISSEGFRISSSIASQVVTSGKSVYTSDALADDRYSTQASVLELHLRSIMCVPIKVKQQIIGVIYVDNSSQTKVFLKSDLYQFELYAQLVANALYNAELYNTLLSMKQYNESVIKLSPVGIVVVDSDGRIATMNPVALEIFDINREDIRSMTDAETASLFLDIIPDEERLRWRNIIDNVLQTQQDLSDSRFFYNTNYVEKVLSLKLHPISSLPNGRDGIILALEDITEKVVMEKYLILSEKLAAKGEMAASIAHELNNHLALASTNAELLSLNIDRDNHDKAKFNAKMIVDNIFKIKRFVDNLMDFAKPEPEYISYDIKHLVEDLLFSLRVQPRFKRSHFTIDLGHDLPNVEMDVGQVQQVLLNLLNNAADAIEERAIKEEESGMEFKREIGLKAFYRAEDEKVVVEVTDNGVGMAKETLDRIFTLHFTTKKGGHGLGLANCRKIIENHHGTIEAESTHGLGTCFRVILPRFQPKHSKQT